MTACPSGACRSAPRRRRWRSARRSDRARTASPARRGRQAIDEQAEVERELRLVGAVPELARDAEAVARKPLDRLLVVRRRSAVEEVDVVRAVLDAVAQDVDSPAARD